MEVVDRHRAVGGRHSPPTWPRVLRLLGGVAMLPSILLALTMLLMPTATSAVSGGGSQHYTDQWAVRIDGTEDDARRLAERHGFIYVDKVSRTSKLFFINAQTVLRVALLRSERSIDNVQ